MPGQQLHIQMRVINNNIQKKLFLSYTFYVHLESRYLHVIRFYFIYFCYECVVHFMPVGKTTLTHLYCINSIEGKLPPGSFIDVLLTFHFFAFRYSYVLRNCF